MGEHAGAISVRGRGRPEDSAGLDLRPVLVPKTFSSVSSEIKRLIFSGVLKPGDRLPSELELARRLGVGRQSVREALRVLELSGFLKVQRGGAGGRIIVDTIARSIGNSLLDAVQFSKITTDELTAARIEIETVTVKYAAVSADETDLRSLRGNIDAALGKIRQGFPAVEENIHFHRLVAKASKNQILYLLAESLLLMLTGSMSRLGFEPSVEKSKKFVADHEAIFRAIVSRDPDCAMQEMGMHLREVTAKLAGVPRSLD